MRSSQSARDLAKKISVLDAIRWIDQSVKNVKLDCVKKCFAACGIKHDGDTEVNENVEEIVEDTDEIEELVTEINPRYEIEELVTEINPRCNVYDYITLDESDIDELVMEKTAEDAGAENEDESDIDELVMEKTAEDAGAENEDDGIGIGTEIEEAYRIKSFSEALRSVAALEEFSQRIPSESMRKKVLELRTVMESSYVLNKNKLLTLIDV
ncbi:hypothetical protein QE152_g32341 [Popillia japonica]|uniref:Uncharacterized protein n=1 Tax=Popillia japonica TaxID=7064 RepID=A0AAW1IZ67_POPJA